MGDRSMPFDFGRSSRRDFLWMTAGGALTGMVGLPALMACTRGSSSGAVQSVSAKVLPQYIPFAGPKPDFPATQNGVQPGYASYPATLVKSIKETPSRGGEITALCLIYGPPPAPMDHNSYWQELNRRLGTTFKPTIVGAADHVTKMNTMIAGGDIPDVMWIPTLGVSTPAHLVELLQSSFADLTSFLAGSAVKDYPNLANFPTYAWRNSVYGGALFGVPNVRSPLDQSLFVRQDLLEQVGLTQPRNTGEFTRLAKELTRPAANQWAIGMQSDFGLPFFQMLFRAPNAWRVDAGGRLVADWETPEKKAAVGYLRDLFAAGVFYPGSGTAAMTATKRKEIFNTGRAVMVGDAFTAFPGYWDNIYKLTTSGRVRVMLPFGHDGGKAPYYTGTGTNGMNVIRKARPERIQEILRIMNYTTAPFGTEEKLFLENGIQGVHFTFDAHGTPVKTTNKDLLAELGVPWAGLASAFGVLYNSMYKDFVPAVYKLEVDLLALSVDNPTAALYSPAFVTLGAQLEQTLSDGMSDIIQGRAPLSRYDSLVRDWKTNGGDRIRSEFQKALELANKKS